MRGAGEVKPGGFFRSIRRCGIQWNLRGFEGLTRPNKMSRSGGIENKINKSNFFGPVKIFPRYATQSPPDVVCSKLLVIYIEPVKKNTIEFFVLGNLMETRIDPRIHPVVSWV